MPWGRGGLRRRGGAGCVGGAARDIGSGVARDDRGRRQGWAASAVNEDVSPRYLAIIFGLALAGWGHLLLSERSLATAAWRRLDDLFPVAWRSSESVAGAGLLAMGGFCVLAAMAGA